MFSYLARRLGLVVIVIFGVMTVVFFLQRLSGDPTNLLLPLDTPPVIRQQLRHELGLDAPLPVQYVRFIGQALQGDIGQSFQYKQPALGLVLARLPRTALLAATALLIAVVLAIPLGVLAAVNRNTWVDTLATGLSLVGQAMPVYWLGLLAILVFSVNLRWFPSMGGGSINALVLPASTLAIYSMARIARLTRSAVLEVLSQDYVRVARAKGVRERSVLYKHVLRNAAIPIVTMVGLQLGGLLGGAVLTEVVFAWPGMGRLAVNAVYNRDFPVVQAVALVAAFLFSFINLLVDVMYAALNPQVQLE
ncbi:MAG: ABC transporter permease [Trueperaceae bacterium]